MDGIDRVLADDIVTGSEMRDLLDGTGSRLSLDFGVFKEDDGKDGVTSDGITGTEI